MDEIQHHVNELEACCKSNVSVNGLIVYLQLPRMVPLLLQKEARGVCLSVLEKAKGMNAN